MGPNEGIRIYASYCNTRKAISYAVLYHQELKMFSVYIKGITIDLRSGEEVGLKRVPESDLDYLYTNPTYRLMYYSNYEKAKICFDELVRNCMDDMYGYPDLLIEKYSEQGTELRPDWFSINDDLQQEEKNFGEDGFSKN